MAQEVPNEIGFRNVQLLKSQSLGVGSYGAVCKAKCDNLLCAAKIIHPTLVDPMAHALVTQGRAHRLPINRFEQECQFLSFIKHPNIVQYLGIHRDPENELPVLLMELMDESLTSFLEHSPRNLAYSIQVTISHDIALALSFLHLNDIIHRDLSSNNVLMIGNSRAKVSDFGMAKLTDTNFRATRGSLTQTPGADVYMPPEANRTPPIYSEKIDCFSHGVLGIQIMTRQFPKPGDRFNRILIQDSRFPQGIEARVSEVERRREHINLIDPIHPLLAIATDCLKDEERQRPSAQEICGRLETLKEAPKFTESVQEQAGLLQSVADEGYLREVQQEVQSKAIEIQQLRKEIDQNNRTMIESIALKDQEIAIREVYISQYQSEKKQIQANCLEKDHLLQVKEGELQRLRKQAAEHERIIKEIEQANLEEARRIIGCNQPSKKLKGNSLEPQETSNDTEVTMDLKWMQGKGSLHAMSRGPDAVAHSSVVYVRPGGTCQIHWYISNVDSWFQLPDVSRVHFTIAVVEDLPTAIGGKQNGQCINTLLSLIVDGQDKKWVEMLPPMPTKRSHTCALSSGTFLIVIGGLGDRGGLRDVEVLDVTNKFWMTATSLPEPLHTASATICGDHIYILGGCDSSGSSTTAVYTCSLSSLLQSCQPTSATTPNLSNNTSIWSKIADLPVKRSTCVTFQGHLLAIGGCDSFYNPTTAVRMYSAATNSWSVISHMTTPRDLCFAAVIPVNRIMVVGGFTKKHTSLENVSVEIAFV